MAFLFARSPQSTLTRTTSVLAMARRKMAVAGTDGESVRSTRRWISSRQLTRLTKTSTPLVFPMTKIEPRVMAGATANFDKVLDLTDAKVQTKIGFTSKELVDEDWETIQASGEESWTQAIGRGCLSAGFEAILVPSARNAKGKNIVIFTANLKGGGIRILTPDKLPR